LEVILVVDIQNPTEQFHRYQRPAVQPHRDETMYDRVAAVMRRAGIGEPEIDRTLSLIRRARHAVRPSTVRGWVRRHPAEIAGAFAVAIVGAAALRRR
jgi:hypothetical protein